MGRLRTSSLSLSVKGCEECLAVAYCSEWSKGGLDPKLELTDKRLLLTLVHIQCNSDHLHCSELASPSPFQNGPGGPWGRGFI